MARLPHYFLTRFIFLCMSEKLLPDILRKDKRLRAFAELEGKNFKEVSVKLPYLFVYKLENLSDSEFEDLAWQFDISKVEWELATDRKQKEELIKNNILLKAKRGTPWAVKRVLELLGLQGQIKEWFEYGGQPYRFKVELGVENREITTSLRDELIKLINEYKNERSWLDELILSYLAKAQVNILTGTMAESTAHSEMITGFEFSSSETAFVYTGTMAEATATAVMEA